jgi:poly [ADP-ribose] polymerase
MAEMIEVAKTGRSRCRVCREPIAKGALRFGEEQPSAFSDGLQWVWHHLECAARKKPVPVRTALAAFQGDVPNRTELEAALAAADESPSVFPYAERAPTGRSKCLQCREAIEKGALRIATERELELGMSTRPGVGYLHVACAREHLQRDDLAAVLRQNSRGLGEADFAEAESLLAG